jgi:dolichol-phosphate mannosyltransferase
MEISIIISVMNEEENVLPLLQQLKSALNDLDYEVIFVDDGSTDNTVWKLISIHDSRIKVVELTRNFGQTAALAAGIAQSKGKYIVTMDGDLQNDPYDIPALYNAIQKLHADMVAGKRVNRKDDFLLRKLPSKIANYLIRKVSKVYVHDYGCALKIMTRKLALSIPLSGELHRFITILAAQAGAKIEEIEVNHNPRINGKSKYGLERVSKVLSDLVFLLFVQHFGSKPIHFFGKIGLALSGTGSLAFFYLLYEKIIGQDIGGRPLLMLAITFIIAGIQLISLGIIMEFILRISYQTGSSSAFTIRHVYVGGEPVVSRISRQTKRKKYAAREPFKQA